MRQISATVVRIPFRERVTIGSSGCPSEHPEQRGNYIAADFSFIGSGGGYNAVAPGFMGNRITNACHWPNPVSSELHFDDVAETSAFHIYSMVGTLMLNGVLKTGSNVVDVRELPAGMYVVEVAGSDGERVLKRIIKQ